MLYNKLKNYSAGGVYPMHMPGHKRNKEYMPDGLPYDIDITEIPGFDDLHDSRGILLETEELASGLYGSDKAFMLVNGSTVGILSAIGAMASHGDKMLVARKCHRSVENAAALFGLYAVSLPPTIDEATGAPYSVDPSAIESALDNDPSIRLVVVTSPSYEGVVSDIGAIAAIAHGRDATLLVDGAHGAHLGFSAGFPESPVGTGADAVVMSLHKTLPALTQCSLLHVCGDRADPGEIRRRLSVLQTSSPSYVLMASIDHCLRLLSSDSGRLFCDYERNLAHFREEIKPLKRLSALSSTCGLSAKATRGGGSVAYPGFYAIDPGKIVISTKKTALSGFRLAELLRDEHKIELELACPDYAIAMTSICDTAEGFDRLAAALLHIDAEI